MKNIKPKKIEIRQKNIGSRLVRPARLKSKIHKAGVKKVKKGR